MKFKKSKYVQRANVNPWYLLPRQKSFKMLKNRHWRCIKSIKVTVHSAVYEKGKQGDVMAFSSIFYFFKAPFT
jgi:hypothetical protein